MKSTLNIVISLPYYPKPGTGTGNAVHGFAKGLNSSGADVIVLAEGDEYINSNYDGVPFIQFPRYGKINPFSVSKDLLSYLKANSTTIDLLIVNGIYVPYVYSISSFSKKIGIPYIHVPHSVYNKTSLNKSRIKKSIYLKLFEKNVLKNALAVQMLSRNQIIDVERLVSPRNCISVPNGIDQQTIDFSEKKSIHLNYRKNRKIKIIFFGRKEIFMKGLDLLIEGFSKIENNNIELYIQGSSAGEERKLNQLIKKFNAKNVYLKEKFEGDVINHLRQFDILIMPSRYEAFSIAVLEGMAAELPIIVSKEVGASPYVLNAEAGIECEPNVRSIAEAIQKMLDNQENWENMGRNGKNYLSENLSWNKIAKDALITYQNLLEIKV